MSAISRRIMGIALRLSLVVAVVAGAWSYYEMHQRYMAEVTKAIQMDLTLSCGKGFSEAELDATKNIYGLIDLRKVGCATERFLAKPEEISRAGALDGRAYAHIKYHHYVSQEGIAGAAIGGALLTVWLGLLVVFLRWLTLWVLGLGRPAA